MKYINENIIDAWNNLKPFNNPNDIPDIPRCDEETYKNFFLPLIIKAGGIPKNKLINGQIYIGNHRNTTIGKWNKEKNVFEYYRTKFGQRFIDICNHFEDDDGYALFVPIKLGNDTDFK